MWTDDDCSVTEVTNYGFNIPAFIKCGELQTVMCIFQASSITVPEVLTSQAWRGTFMKTPTSWCSKTNTHIVLNMQILNRYACTKLCQLPEEKLLNIEAVQTNVDISKVLKAANWTRLTTMQRHYFNVSSRWLGFHTWPVKCTVVIILLLLWADQVFRCYCEQTLFSFATVSKLYCFFEILVSFWKHFLFLRETLQILILLALLSYQLVWVKIRFFI